MILMELEFRFKLAQSGILLARSVFQMLLSLLNSDCPTQPRNTSSTIQISPVLSGTRSKRWHSMNTGRHLVLRYGRELTWTRQQLTCVNVGSLDPMGIVVVAIQTKRLQTFHLPGTCLSINLVLNVLMILRMMDQLASIGVGFQHEFIDHIFAENAAYYENPPKVPTTISSIFSRRPQKQWAIEPIYEKHKPIRPFGLGEVFESETGYYVITGKTIRTPGLYHRADPDTGMPTNTPMTHTNERIHSCVRIRIELEGLGLDDIGPYKCQALTKKGPWVLRQRRISAPDPIAWNATWGAETPPATTPPEELRWVWEYDGPEDRAPRVRTMVEENLGPYQRKLLLLNKGKDEFHKPTSSSEASDTVRYVS